MMDWVIEHITDLAKRIWMSTSKYRCKKCGKGTYKIIGERKDMFGMIVGNYWRCNNRKCEHKPVDAYCQKLDNL